MLKYFPLVNPLFFLIEIGILFKNLRRQDCSLIHYIFLKVQCSCFKICNKYQLNKKMKEKKHEVPKIG